MKENVFFERGTYLSFSGEIYYLYIVYNFNRPPER